jgi:hypothetical protein
MEAKILSVKTGSDTKQDYQNNTVGRRYAAEGVPESQIPHRVRTDPRVMRFNR